MRSRGFAPRPALAQSAAMSAEEDAREALARAQARLDALELELERAHRTLDAYDVPRAFRAPGERDPVEYSLHARLDLLFADESE